MLAIHPYRNGKIIINYPGAGGSVDGYKNKYKTLAEYIVNQKFAAVIRLPYSSENNFRETLNYILKHSMEICGVANPELYLMSVSAGAGAIATIAREYPNVRRILLIEPTPININGINSVQNYKGELYVIVGDGDECFGIKVGKQYLQEAINASRKEIFEISNCDHLFSGERCGKILSQAPFYAFSDDPKPSFPDEKAGVKLYN